MRRKIKKGVWGNQVQKGAKIDRTYRVRISQNQGQSWVGVKVGWVETEAEVKLVKVGIKVGVKIEVKVDIRTEGVQAKLLV